MPGGIPVAVIAWVQSLIWVTVNTSLANSSGVLRKWSSGKQAPGLLDGSFDKHMAWSLNFWIPNVRSIKQLHPIVIKEPDA